MIPRPAAVTEFENYLTDLVNDMVIKGGEVSDLMSSYNAVFDVQFANDHSIKQETKATADKFPTIIGPVINLAEANKRQLTALDAVLNSAPDTTNPNNLIANVTDTHNRVKDIANQVSNAIYEVKKTAGKTAAYLSAAHSIPTKTLTIPQNSNYEAISAVQNFDRGMTLSNVKGEAQYKMNNLNGVVDSAINQFNNIQSTLSNTYNGPLSSI